MKNPDILVKTALTNLIHNHKSRYRGIVFWGLVADIFGLGSTSSIELCEMHGFDPWMKLK
jgi:hypothetical protein